MNDLISKKVLLEVIKGWENQDEYYHGRKAKTIPLSEIKLMIEECPLAGDDSAYLAIKDKRLKSEYIRGTKETLMLFSALVKNIENKLDSEAEE